MCEGVEDWDQVTALRELNCTAGQGDYFGEALDLPGALALIALGPLDLTNPDRGAGRDAYARAGSV